MIKISKILNLLTSSEKKKFFILLILILIMALIEMLGVASIFPFIAILTNPDLIETNSYLNYIYEFSNNFGIINKEQFIFYFGLCFLLFLIFGLLIKATTQFLQTRFVLMREYSLGKRLIENYVNQPYFWFLNQNTANLGKIILSEVSQVVGGTIMPLLNIVAQSIVVSSITILIFFVDTKLALYSVSILFIIYGSIYYFIKNYLTRKGSERLDANKDKFTIVNEAFGTVKEMKILNLEDFFVKKFEKPSKIVAHNLSLIKIIGQVPRYAIEGIAFGGVIILIKVLISQGKSFNEIAPLLGLYAFAGYRLMPALQQLYSAFTQLRFSEPALEDLYRDLNLIKKIPSYKNTKKMSFDKLIRLKNVEYSYPNSHHKTLNNINISIPVYSRIGIVGKTGSGKTTIVDIIMGLLEIKKGELLIDDKPINNNSKSWQQNIGYVPQQIFLSNTSIKSNIAFGVNNNDIDIQALENASKIANLHDFVTNELPNGYETEVGERGIRLSGGQRQRIAIARALYHKPKLLVLDEATSALDNFTEKIILESINNLDHKITIIMIAHRLNTVKECDQIFLIEGGEIKKKGTYEEVIENTKISV